MPEEAVDSYTSWDYLVFDEDFMYDLLFGLSFEEAMNM